MHRHRGGLKGAPWLMSGLLTKGETSLRVFGNGHFRLETFSAGRESYNITHHLVSYHTQ